MKKVGKLMQELGFNKDAPDSAKEAFIRHLIKVSTGTNVTPRNSNTSAPPSTPKKSSQDPEQMTFHFEDKDPSKKAM